MKDDEQVVRFKELESIIDHNQSIRDDFNQLLHLQKRMVQKETLKSSDYLIAKEEYEKQLQLVLNYPIVEEYLELLDMINSDLSIIKSIIESEIAKDFD